MRPDGGFDSNNRVGYLSYGRIRSIDYFKFTEKYWWLRSPSTGYNYGTWSVWPGGSLDSYYYIEDSYGRRSPLTWDVAGAYDVRSSGDVGYYYDSDGVIPSYGRTDRRTRIGIILLFF